jgi:hypothetical protein
MNGGFASAQRQSRNKACAHNPCCLSCIGNESLMGQTSQLLEWGDSRRGKGELRGMVTRTINVIFGRRTDCIKAGGPTDRKADSRPMT